MVDWLSQKRRAAWEWVRPATGRFGRVSARSSTRPVSIGFGQFQPAMNNKNDKPVGYSGRTDRVCVGGLVRFIRAGRVERIIFSIFSISHASISFKSTNPRTNHYLLAISLKPTNKSLPLQTQTKPNPSLMSPSPSNPQTATNPNPSEKKKERKRESKREREKKKPFKPFLLSIISNDQIVEG